MVLVAGGDDGREDFGIVKLARVDDHAPVLGLQGLFTALVHGLLRGFGGRSLCRFGRLDKGGQGLAAGKAKEGKTRYLQKLTSGVFHYLFPLGSTWQSQQ